jgi:hypothetical protein
MCRAARLRAAGGCLTAGQPPQEIGGDRHRREEHQAQKPDDLAPTEIVSSTNTNSETSQASASTTTITISTTVVPVLAPSTATPAPIVAALAIARNAPTPSSAPNHPIGMKSPFRRAADRLDKLCG